MDKINQLLNYNEIKDIVEFCKIKDNVLNHGKGFAVGIGNFEENPKKISLGSAFFGVRNHIIRIYKSLEKNEKICFKATLKEKNTNEKKLIINHVYLLNNDKITTEYEEISRFSIPCIIKSTEDLPLKTQLNIHLTNFDNDYFYGIIYNGNLSSKQNFISLIQNHESFFDPFSINEMISSYNIDTNISLLPEDDINVENYLQLRKSQNVKYAFERKVIF